MSATPPDVRRQADSLRGDMARLAGHLREALATSDAETSPAVRAARSLAGEPIGPAALRFAELMAEGEAIVVRISKHRNRPISAIEQDKAALGRLRTNLERRIQRRQERALDDATAAGSAPDYLEALVMRHIGGQEYTDKLHQVLRHHRTPPGAIDKPSGDMWSWLVDAGLQHTLSKTALPAEVRRLRQLGDGDFLDVLLADARSSPKNPWLSHPAIVGQWARLAARAESQASLARGQARAVLAGRTAAPADTADFDRLRAACETYARAAARRTEAQLLALDLQVKAVSLYRQKQHQSARAARLKEAAALVARKNPQQWRMVQTVCADHRRRCKHVNDPHPCRDCASAVAAEVRRRLAGGTTAQAAPAPQRPAAAAAPRQPARAAAPPGAEADVRVEPVEQSHHTPWLAAAEPTSTTRNLRWRTTLHRSHLDAGWCPLPEIGLDRSGPRRTLQLRLDHIDRNPAGAVDEQSVTLRRIAGQWELRGIRWPSQIEPGVILRLHWSTSTSVVSARTEMLPTPVLIDGVEYLHRYDPPVVTREKAPGADEDRPDLTDTGWVMRTLRRLGHLSADGSATLAADSLIGNCVGLGMPRARVPRMDKAIDRLLQSGQIYRLQGSRDRDHIPYHPPRPGQTPVELLHYRPHVKQLHPDVRRQVEEAWLRHRTAHTVAPFVRRLPPGATASDEQIDLYHEAQRNAQVVNRPLPASHTFVRGHHRGRADGR